MRLTQEGFEGPRPPNGDRDEPRLIPKGFKTPRPNKEATMGMVSAGQMDIIIQKRDLEWIYIFIWALLRIAGNGLSMEKWTVVDVLAVFAHLMMDLTLMCMYGGLH